MGLLLKLGIQQNVTGLSIGDWLGSFVGIKIGINEGIKLGFSNWKLVGTTLGAVVGVPIFTYVGSGIGSLEVSTYGYVDGKFGGFLYQCMDLRSKQINMLN